MLADRIRLSAHALIASAGSLILFSHLLPIRKQRRNKVDNDTVLKKCVSSKVLIFV